MALSVHRRLIKAFAESMHFFLAATPDAVVDRHPFTWEQRSR